MILAKIVKKDFLRKKIITVVVFTFILLSALLVATGSNLIVELSNSLNALFAKSNAPHFVQMHAGEIDQAEIDRWTAANSLVQAQQTVEMITLDGSNLTLGANQTAEESSIMDISFVKQNVAFDFLLDLENQIIQLAPGEIAVPIYYMQRDDMKLGDPVKVSNGTFDAAFTVAAFVRDAQMNPAVVHSKRFLVHDADYAALQEHFPESEYLIEFLLTDTGQIGEFSQDYLASSLPKKGPAVDYRLFKTFNALTDGIVAGVVIVLSLLLVVIAILCLRFTILATIEEDTKEIGVMKAIGIARRDINGIYLAKYVVMGGCAALLGYLASLYVNQLLASNIMLYIGRAPRSGLQQAVPLAAASSIFLIVVFSCAIILRRLHRITALEAMRSGSIGESVKQASILHLKNSKLLDVNIFLGIRDVVQRFRSFGLLCFVFFFSTAIILIPIHFLTTIQSPSFIAYLGIGRSHIRIDLRQSDNIVERFESMVDYLRDDPDVASSAPLVTSQFTLVQSDGSREAMNIETGDLSLFPLDYVEGVTPQQENEIALSFLNAQDTEKLVGDTLVLLVNEQELEMVVSGIYQDVTNGGRTAKALLPYNPENVLWYTVNLDLRSPDHLDEKVREYAAAFDPARVTDLEGYLGQTMGNTIDQFRNVTIVAIVVSLFVSMLITSLFLSMLITKDSAQIAIMRSLGFSLRNIRVQYLIRTLLLLGIGLVVGTIFSNTVGQRIVSALWAFMGASQIRFVIDSLQSYVLFPLLLILTVAITTLISIAGIRETSIAQTIAE